MRILVVLHPKEEGCKTIVINKGEYWRIWRLCGIIHVMGDPRERSSNSGGGEWLWPH